MENNPTGSDLEDKEKTKAEQSLFIQEVLLATLTDDKLSLRQSRDTSALSNKANDSLDHDSALPPTSSSISPQAHLWDESEDH